MFAFCFTCPLHFHAGVLFGLVWLFSLNLKNDTDANFQRMEKICKEQKFGHQYFCSNISCIYSALSFERFDYTWCYVKVNYTQIGTYERSINVLFHFVLLFSIRPSYQVLDARITYIVFTAILITKH
jgi:hypothetical protein